MHAGSVECVLVFASYIALALLINHRYDITESLMAKGE